MDFIMHMTVRLKKLFLIKKMKKENQLLHFTKNYSLKQQNLNYAYANELFLFSFLLALPPAHPTKKRYPTKKRFSLCKKINQMVRQYNKYLNIKQNIRW